MAKINTKSGVEFYLRKLIKESLLQDFLKRDLFIVENRVNTLTVKSQHNSIFPVKIGGRLTVVAAGENGTLDEQEVITVKLPDGRVTRLLIVKKVLDADSQFIVRDVGRFREPKPMTVVAN